MRNMYTTIVGYKYAISFISSHMIMPHIFLHLDIECLVNEWLEELSSSYLECEDIYTRVCVGNETDKLVEQPKSTSNFLISLTSFSRLMR